MMPLRLTGLKTKFAHSATLWLLCGFCFIATAATNAEDAPSPLPDPLTLEAALANVSDQHPKIATAHAEQALAQSTLDRAKANDDGLLNLSLQARYIDPNDNAFNTDSDDSRAVLSLDKTLYDFGRTHHQVAAGEALIQARQQQKNLAFTQQRQAVMQRFFDVILADLAYATANEDMAIKFVSFDKQQDRHELEEISDTDLLESETRYQAALLRFRRAENEQRQARSRLALALNRPGELSSDVLPPDLPGIKNPLPDFKSLLAEARNNNPDLSALRGEVQSQLSQKKAARAESRPELFLRLEANEYQRDLPSRDPFTAIVGLDVPLYRGNRTGAAVARQEAGIAAAKARLRAAEYQLEQTLLEQMQAVETLRLQLNQAQVLSDFRDSYLDRSRANYELEIKTDLGDAMTLQTEARLFSMRTQFELALALEKLAELTGNSAYSALHVAQSDDAAGQAAAPDTKDQPDNPPEPTASDSPDSDADTATTEDAATTPSPEENEKP